MRHKLIPLFSVILLLTATVGARGDRVDEFIKSKMKESQIPGLSLAVIRNGKIVKAKGYGLANVELNVAATPETVYRLASTGKLFIATGIMLVAEEGKLSLDDPVSKYLAGTPDAWQKITVRHLLSHTSGVAKEAPGYDDFKIQKDADVIKTAYLLPLLFTPGEKAAYSNLGYFILGEIISKASGKPWSKYLNERVFKPLQMNATRTTSMADIVLNRASGYFVDGDKLQNVQIPLALRPSGAFLSNVLDLAKFDAALYTERILKKSSLEQMWQPVKETDTGEGVVKGSSFGFGWVVANVNGHRAVSKGGSNTGFRARFVRFADDNLTVVILANGENVSRAFAYEVANFYIPGLADTDPQRIESIAVIPFVNATGSGNLEYLLDGMTESLIGSLSQFPKLNVKPCSSIFRYKGRDINPQTVGSELSVQAVLLGRVIQRGEQLTLSLTLVDARTENVIWHEQYSRKQTDLARLQREIARDVAKKLRVKLSRADEQRLAKNYAANAEAYQLYLLGRFHWNKRTVSDFRKAIEYFQQAVIADPSYALAYAGLADSYMLLSEYDGAAPHEVIPKARQAAMKALSLNNQLAEAHTALGLALFDDYDLAGAEREYKRALALNSQDATAHQRYGQLLTYSGRYEDGLAEVRRALEIEPLSLIFNRSYGTNLFWSRRYEQSIAQLKKTRELDANWALPYASLANAYWMKGDYAESVEEFAKYREMQGRQQDAALVRESFSKGGWEGFLRLRIEELRGSTVNSFGAAEYHAALGEKDEAFAALNKAYDNHEYGLLVLKVDSRLDPLRDDPRFQDLLRRVGFSTELSKAPRN